VLDAGVSVACPRRNDDAVTVCAVIVLLLT
jgi:hypothetical protein